MKKTNTRESFVRLVKQYPKACVAIEVGSQEFLSQARVLEKLRGGMQASRLAPYAMPWRWVVRQHGKRSGIRHFCGAI